MKFDPNGNLVGDRFTYIPAKHVRIIRENLKQGKKYPEVSPMYLVTREQVAFILKSMKKG